MRGAADLVAEVVNVDSSPSIPNDAFERGDVTLAQVEITGTATYMIQGRLSPTASWVDLLDADQTENNIFALASAPHYRLVNKTGTTGSTKLFLK